MKLTKLNCVMFALLVAGGSFNAVIAQEPECGTEDRPEGYLLQQPWAGNNLFLFQLLDSMGYSIPQVPSFSSQAAQGLPYDVPEAIYRIPVRFWFYQGSTGQGGPQDLFVQRNIDALNYYYSGGSLNRYLPSTSISGLCDEIDDNVNYQMVVSSC